jgi:hypothetical protein
VNAAVLMFTACLAGQGPAPMPYAQAPMPYAQAPVVVYPNQGYGYAAPGYGQGQGHCFGCGFGSHGQAFGGHGGNCCGHASVDCCGEDKCCLLKKIKDKLCCIHIHITCEKKNSCCDKGPVCPKACAPACPPKPVCHQPCPPKPVCNPCPPKPVCCPKPACEKPACCKVEPTCHTPCTKICWTPGYCLHKCKEKLCNLCGTKGGHECHGGCGTAATPNACGSTVIAPPAGTVIPQAVPVNPTPVAPKAMPDGKKLQSNYGPVRPELQPVAGTAPRVIDLTPSPF